jgi:hypothetical protein
MKNLILFIALTAIITGCASIKGSISNAHKSDVAVKVDSSSIKSTNALKAENASLQAELNAEKWRSEQKDIQVRTIEENAAYVLQGGTTSGGVKGDRRADVIIKTINRGRIKSVATYYAKGDSLNVVLIVRDTIINIHRKETIASDKSNINTESHLHTNSQGSVNNTSSVVTESKSTASSSRDKKTSDTVKLSFGASIGISNWWPVIIALIVGLSIGIILGRKSKK